MAYSNNIALDAKYNGEITLLDAVQDPKIHEKLEKFYVPEVEITSNPNGKIIFLKRDASIALGETGPRTIRFIYATPKGVNVTPEDGSFIQVGHECKGFLARISVSRANFIPSALTLDYFVDISSIKYRIDAVISAVKNVETGVTEMVSQEVLKFDNVEFRDYTHLNMDPMLREFSMNKEYFFERYFA